MGEFSATISAGPYWACVSALAVTCVVLCTWSRLRPGRWGPRAAKVIGVVLFSDCVVDTVRQLTGGTWHVKTSLPLALCNFALFVAAAACWWRVRLLVEVTYYWALAGTVQGLVTPDLNVGFPHLEFFEYVIGHTLIIVAALFLVVGLGLQPRSHSVLRVTMLTYIYVALVGLVDAVLGANYMFLRTAPHQWTLLRLMGPYPWYLVTGVVVVPLFFALLYSPFWLMRRGEQSSVRPISASLRTRS
ncbi:MAG: TIGR02206 family membrane protein [Acidimicrobiales bacterium]